MISFWCVLLVSVLLMRYVGIFWARFFMVRGEMLDFYFYVNNKLAKLCNYDDVSVHE
jgi:hypothetical protein